jgi:hypothetical protein
MSFQRRKKDDDDDNWSEGVLWCLLSRHACLRGVRPVSDEHYELDLALPLPGAHWCQRRRWRGPRRQRRQQVGCPSRPEARDQRSMQCSRLAHCIQCRWQHALEAPLCLRPELSSSALTRFRQASPFTGRAAGAGRGGPSTAVHAHAMRPMHSIQVQAGIDLQPQQRWLAGFLWACSVVVLALAVAG